MSRIFLLIAIFIIQIIVVKSQFTVNPITPNPDPSNQPIALTYHIIKVGYKDSEGKVGYSRNNLTANRGESLRWEWLRSEFHSVVESTLDNPCLKKPGGFDLGKHSEPFNNSIIVADSNPLVFFSDVSDDCMKGMYGGVNLPLGYEWPTNLKQPPQQIVTTPLNTPTPTPTGSVSIAAVGAENTQGSSSSDSVSTYYLKESSFGIIIGSLMLISFYFNIVISN